MAAMPLCPAPMAIPQTKTHQHHYKTAMKMKNLLLASGVLLASANALSSCAKKTSAEGQAAEEAAQPKKVLVAFFSHTGENYAVGNITKGNTHIVAEMIAQKTGGDLFEIVPAEAYPDGYEACVEVATREKDANARPEIKADHDIDGYDTIFIGYPIWCGDAPMPVYTWTGKHQWQGKTIVPFCTHEGSGLGVTPQNLGAACAGSSVAEAFDLRGNVAQNQPDKAKEAVEVWLAKLGF